MSRNRLTTLIALAASSAFATSSGFAAPLSIVSAGALAPAASTQPVTTPVNPQSATSMAAPISPSASLSAGSLSAMGMLPSLHLNATSGLGQIQATAQPSMLSLLLGSMQMGAGTLGRWEDYALTELMPRSVGLNLDLPSAALEPSPINESLLMPHFARMWELDRQRYLTFGLSETQASENYLVNDDTPTLRNFEPGMNLERHFVSTGLAQSFGDHSTLGVAAVTAYQHFATYSATSNSVTGIAENELYRGRETAVGTGIRVGLASEVAEGVSVGATYQSRIDFDPLQSYRGVYSDPADFDVPASAGVGIALQASQSSAITFDVQRVLYSDINAFTSSLMPDRFLSLLGDGSSPNFNWQDLTVYSVGYQWQTSEDLLWHVNYSTRQQPLPSDDQLAQALTPGFADNNVRVGFSKQISRTSRFDFSASYNPDNIYRDTASDSELDQLEVEAFWVWDF